MQKEKRIMLNEDCNHFIASRKSIIDSVDEEYLKSFIDQYADTDVSDFVMNIAATISFVPSETRQFAGDKYLVKEEMGKKVDYSDTELKCAYILWYEKKLDMYKIWIDRCRYNGINPWLSFRMNDAELTNIPNHLLSDYYYEHFTDYSRTKHREPQNPIETCRDYEIEDFRNYQLDYIKEMLERYDVYGIELDFQREIYCFRIGHEWQGIEIMNEFMKKVKEIVTVFEMKYGHKIKISVRCHAYPQMSLEFGFDIASWAELGLIDLAIPSPNWLTTDNNLPIKIWKQLLNPYGVGVVGCFELNVNGNPEYMDVMMKNYETKGLEKHSVETLCASAVNLLSKGSDGIYLFNFMDIPDCMGEKYKRFGFDTSNYKTVLSYIDNLEEISLHKRRHLITFCDNMPPWYNTNAVLPLRFSENTESKYLRIETGIVPKGMRMTVRIAMNKLPQDCEVFLNSEKTEYQKTMQCEAPVLTENTLYCYTVPNEAIQDHVQVVEIITSNTVIDYVDIIVEK